MKVAGTRASIDPPADAPPLAGAPPAASPAPPLPEAADPPPAGAVAPPLCGVPEVEVEELAACVRCAVEAVVVDRCVLTDDAAGALPAAGCELPPQPANTGSAAARTVTRRAQGTGSEHICR